MKQWWLYRNIGYLSKQMPEYEDSLEAHVIEFAEYEKLKEAFDLTIAQLEFLPLMYKELEGVNEPTISVARSMVGDIP